MQRSPRPGQKWPCPVSRLKSPSAHILSSQQSLGTAEWISVFRSGTPVAGPWMTSWKLEAPKQPTSPHMSIEGGSGWEPAAQHSEDPNPSPFVFFHQRSETQFPPVLHAIVRDPAFETSDLRPFGYQTSYLSKPICLTALQDEAILWHCDWATEHRQRVFLAPALSSLFLPPLCQQSHPPETHLSPALLRSLQQVLSPRSQNNLTCPMNPCYPPHPHSVNRIPISDSLLAWHIFITKLTTLGIPSQVPFSLAIPPHSFSFHSSVLSLILRALTISTIPSNQ